MTVALICSFGVHEGGYVLPIPDGNNHTAARVAFKAGVFVRESCGPGPVVNFFSVVWTGRGSHLSCTGKSRVRKGQHDTNVFQEK